MKKLNKLGICKYIIVNDLVAFLFFFVLFFFGRKKYASHKDAKENYSNKFFVTFTENPSKSFLSIQTSSLDCTQKNRAVKNTESDQLF